MKVLAVVPYYPPEGGGLERYAQATLTRLAARGHDVVVLAHTRGEPGQSERDGVLVERRAPAIVVGNAPVDPSLPLRVAARVRDDRPDVVLAHTPVPFPAEAAWLGTRGSHVPLVVTYHAGELRGSTPWLRALASLDRATLHRAMLGGAAALVAVSPYVRDHALANHGPTAVVPPGVDVDALRPGGPADPHHVLFVGPLDRTYRWKGLDVLLEALRRLAERFPDLEATLVGEGDRLPELRASARRLPYRLHLPGRVGEGGLHAAYRRATVTVLPSTSPAESFGMVLAEANACERPVVASRVGGIPSFVHHGTNGLLAEPGDARDLASCLAEVLSDPGLAKRLGEAGRARVERWYRWDHAADRTEAVLEAVVAGDPLPPELATAPTEAPQPVEVVP